MAFGLSQFNSRTSLPVQCRTKQTKLEGITFLSWATVAPTEFSITFLSSDCPS